MISGPKLNWALVIATYGRGAVLLRALATALRQSRPPSEIIIVDGNPDHALWAERTRKLVESQNPAIRLVHVGAERLSLTVQRNQGIGLATADVVMLFDDDSLLFDDCAERIMEIMERDTQGRVVGGRTTLEATPPVDGPGAGPAGAGDGGGGALGRVRQVMRDWAGNEMAFPPYDADRKVTPEDDAYLRSIGALPAECVSGCCMFFRRTLFRVERFEELLSRYAYCEDRDMGFRAARHGLIALAPAAKVCHLQVTSGRMKPFESSATHVLNSAVLHRLNSSDVARSFAIFRKYTGRRALFLALKDLRARDWRLPRCRGTLYARGLLGRVARMPKEEVRGWYEQVQDQLLTAGRA